MSIRHQNGHVETAMNREEFDGASESFKRRNPHLFANFDHLPRREHTVAQKQQDADAREADNQAGVSEDHAPNGARFRISVEIGVSDKRLRDTPGMLETVCDCLVTAGRQLAGIGDRKGVLQTRAIRRGVLPCHY